MESQQDHNSRNPLPHTRAEARLPPSSLFFHMRGRYRSETRAATSPPPLHTPLPAGAKRVSPLRDRAAALGALAHHLLPPAPRSPRTEGRHEPTQALRGDKRCPETLQGQQSRCCPSCVEIGQTPEETAQQEAPAPLRTPVSAYAAQPETRREFPPGSFTVSVLAGGLGHQRRLPLAVARAVPEAGPASRGHAGPTCAARPHRQPGSPRRSQLCPRTGTDPARSPPRSPPGRARQQNRQPRLPCLLKFLFLYIFFCIKKEKA